MFFVNLLLGCETKNALLYLVKQNDENLLNNWIPILYPDGKFPILEYSGRQSIIHLASIYGNFDFICKYPNLEIRSITDENLQTPLHLICMTHYGSSESFLNASESLISIGCDPYALDKYGKNALYYSLVNRNFEMISFLKFDTNRMIGKKTIIEQLLDEFHLDNIVDVIDFLIQENTNIEIPNSEGILIFYKIIRNHYLVKKLWNHHKWKKLFTHIDKKGNNILHYLFSEKEVSLDVLKFLNQVNILQKYLSTKNYNKIAPIEIVFENFTKIAKELLDWKIININEITENGNSLLHNAIIRLEKDIVKILIELSANLNLNNTQSMNSFDLAVQTKDEEIQNWILERGVAVKKKTYEVCDKNILSKYVE